MHVLTCLTILVTNQKENSHEYHLKVREKPQIASTAETVNITDISMKLKHINCVVFGTSIFTT